MKYIIIILVFISLYSFLWGEDKFLNISEIDSLFVSPKNIYSGDTLTLFISGNILYKNNKFYDAIPYFEEYLRKAKTDSLFPQTLYYIGNSYQQLANNEKATKFYTILNKYYPNSSYGIIALKNLGDIYFLDEDYQAAMLLYWNFVYHNTDMDLKDKAFFQIERCKYYLGIYEYPSQIHKSFITKFPKSKLSPKLHLDLANYYFTRDKIDLATEEYKAMIELYPKFSKLDTVYYKLAVCHKKRKELNNSIQLITKLLKRFPHTKLKKKSLELLSDIIQMDNDLLSAINNLNLIIQDTSPDKRNIYYALLARLYLKIGLYKEALSIYHIMLTRENDISKRSFIETKIDSLNKILNIDTLSSNSEAEIRD